MATGDNEATSPFTTEERAHLVWFSEWAERHGLSLWAVGLYVVFAAAIIAGTLAFVLGPGISETSTQREINANGDLVKTTTEESSPVPVDALVALLGFGSVLVLPLKYLWDDLANASANRRAVTTKTRERVHAYLKTYYMPMLRTLNDLWYESKRCAEEFANPASTRREATLNRWLYAVAQLCEARAQMRHDGGGWFFRSHKGEYELAVAFSLLEQYFDDTFEENGWERSLLATALQDLKPRDFFSFLQKLGQNPNAQGTPERWKLIVRFRNELLGQKAEPDLFQRMSAHAGHTAILLEYNVTETYAPWYRDFTGKDDRVALIKSRDWLNETSNT